MAKEILYGFHQLKDVLDQPVTGAMIPSINTAITKTLQEYDRQMTALLNLFCFRTTQFKFRYKSPAIKRLQDLDENGRARKTKSPGYYDIAFPIRGAGDAWGANYVTEQKLSVRDINDWMVDTLTADKRWVCDQILIAFFAKTPYVFEDEERGRLTIQPLANGDDQPYLIKVGSEEGATDNHLLAQLEAPSDASNPFRMIHRELVEHPENGGEDARVIVMVPTNVLEEIEGLSTYREIRDIDIQAGLGESVLRGTLDVPVPGIVRGKVNKNWIVEWNSLPDDYLIATTAEADPALGMREHEQASLQGFFELPMRSDTPYRERQFQRHCGFGGYNRVGGLAMKFGAPAYAAPDGYNVPVSGG